MRVAKLTSDRWLLASLRVQRIAAVFCLQDGAGKPVVATPIEELQTYSDYLYFASNSQEAVEQIEKALRETDPGLKAARLRE